jgi:hypothetical protein
VEPVQSAPPPEPPQEAAMSAEKNATEHAWFTERHEHSGSSIGFRITSRLSVRAVR